MAFVRLCFHGFVSLIVSVSLLWQLAALKNASYRLKQPKQPRRNHLDRHHRQPVYESAHGVGRYRSAHPCHVKDKGTSRKLGMLLRSIIDPVGWFTFSCNFLTYLAQSIHPSVFLKLNPCRFTRLAISTQIPAKNPHFAIHTRFLAPPTQMQIAIISSNWLHFALKQG